MERIICIIEDAGSNYAAFFPQILGVATTGSTIEEVKRNSHDALKFYKEESISSALDLPKELERDYELVFYKMEEV